MTTTSKPPCLRRFFLLNMGIAFMVLAVAIYMTITGEYASLAERQQFEGILNRVTIGAILYAALAWYANAYFSPRCRVESNSAA